jgi:glycosyltransferase involved in cell wall biosynthesis
MTERTAGPKTEVVQTTDLPLVLHVIPTTVARGAQLEARALADQLDRPGVRVHRVLSLFDGPAEVVADLSLGHRGGSTPGVGYSWPLVRRVRAALDRFDPAVVVAHGSEPLKYLVPAMAGHRRPLVYYAIGTYSGGDRQIQLRLWRYLFSRVDLVAAEGDEVLAEYVTRFGVPSSRAALAPNGRDPDLFRPRSADESDGPADPPLVIFVGALTSGKRPDRFIDLVAAARAEGVSLRAELFGDGPLGPGLTAPAHRAGVELRGSRADIADQMRRADVLVFCSRPAGEGMPGVLIEAGLSGLPVVATDVPGVRSIVDDGRTGIVVGVEDGDALLAATTRLIGDPELRSAMGRAARRRCVERFSLAAVGDRWLSLLEPWVGTDRTDPSDSLRTDERHGDRVMTTPSSPKKRIPRQVLDGLPDPQGKLEWAKLYASSAWGARRNPAFADLEHFCAFIGYSRSGHTLIGTTLNAHPDVVISHELDAVNFVRHGFRRSQLFSLILERDQHFGTMGRTWSGYAYDIPGQYQGRFERLRVIGDKRARSTVLQIAQQPGLLDRLRREVAVPLKVLHVTRNPFDNIATEARRHQMTLGEATSWYQDICEAVAVVRPLLDPSELLDVRYESFATDPRASLAGICRFVGVQPAAEYLDACAGIVWPSTNRTRDAVEWSPDERRGVERLIERFDVLGHYTFDG